MITEEYDKNSGAILFKKDPDSLRLEEILKLLKDLESRVKRIEDSLSSK